MDKIYFLKNFTAAHTKIDSLEKVFGRMERTNDAMVREVGLMETEGNDMEGNYEEEGRIIILLDLEKLLLNSP